MVQPHSLLHIIIYHFGQQRYPCHIPYIDKWYPLFVLFIYFSTQYKERKFKKHTSKQSGEEALNRNHRAYNIRLPQLQLMMATHAQLQVYNN